MGHTTEWHEREKEREKPKHKIGLPRENEFVYHHHQIDSLGSNIKGII